MGQRRSLYMKAGAVNVITGASKTEVRTHRIVILFGSDDCRVPEGIFVGRFLMVVGEAYKLNPGQGMCGTSLSAAGKLPVKNASSPVGAISISVTIETPKNETQWP